MMRSRQRRPLRLGDPVPTQQVAAVYGYVLVGAVCLHPLQNNHPTLTHFQAPTSSSVL